MEVSRMLMALAITATLLIESAMSATYTVGDSDGWEIGTDFNSWTSTKKFLVGDILNFEYSPNHDVVEVTESDFSCQPSKPIKRFSGGSTSITLSNAGKRFFICGVSGHCTAGMKLQIDILQASSSPPPRPSAAAPPAETPSASASPPAPPAEPSSPPSPSPAPEAPAPPFSFELPLNPVVSPMAGVKPPPPPSSAYKCIFRVDLFIAFSFFIVVLLAL